MRCHRQSRWNTERVGFEDTGAREDDWAEGAAELEREGANPVVTALESEGRPYWARMVGQTDLVAMAALLRAIDASATVPRLRFRDLTTPLIAVLTEQPVETACPMPDHAQVVRIPDTDHVGVVEHHEIVWSLIRSLSGSASAPHRA